VLDTDRIRNRVLCNADIPCGKLTMGHVWQDVEPLALCDEVDRLRDLLAKALPWIDPNDRHEDYLLTVAIREALGKPT